MVIISIEIDRSSAEIVHDLKPFIDNANDEREYRSLEAFEGRSK